MEDTVANSALQLIKDLGIFQILVAFLIPAGAMYGMLEKAQTFGKDKHEVNAIISIAIGLVTVFSFHIIDFFQNFLPIVIILSMFIFVGVLMTGWMGLDPKFLIDMMKNPAVFIPAVLLIFVLVIIGYQGGLDLLTGDANYTGPMGKPVENYTAEDLANPAVLLAQPQVVGAIFLLAIFGVVSFMVTKK